MGYKYSNTEADVLEDEEFVRTDEFDDETIALMAELGIL